MGHFDATRGKQALEIRSSLSERRALTDPIWPGDSADHAHTRSRQWAKAHGELKNCLSVPTFDYPHICVIMLKILYLVKGFWNYRQIPNTEIKAYNQPDVFHEEYPVGKSLNNAP